MKRATESQRRVPLVTPASDRVLRSSVERQSEDAPESSDSRPEWAPRIPVDSTSSSVGDEGSGDDSDGGGSGSGSSGDSDGGSG